MSSVDDRIVNMQFNNKQFTAGAAESSKALQDLDKTIANTGKGAGLQTMADGVDGISKRFSALEVTGVAALATIVSKATSAGLSLLKSFTIDPILDGFSEYQINLNSIQSIMANTGATLKPVNAALNELNHYADLTVYNFSQMASAVGRFTAAGVALDPAVTAIKGMANTAALTGASADDLNRAMYQTSQALSTGVIHLMDWRSLENANLGTKNMREALMATAGTFPELGKNMTDSIAKFGSFRDSLQSGWLTADVFTKAMKVMGGTIDETTGKTVAYSKQQLIQMGFTEEQAKQLTKLSQAAIDSATVIKTFPQLLTVVKESIGSVFSQLFSNVVGNFTQSKAIWTRVGNAITGQVSSWGNALNVMTLEWAKAGGRNQVIKGFARIFRNLGKIIGAFTGAFRDIFPPATAKDLSAISKSFNQFTKNLKVGSDTVANLRKIFGGVFAVMHIGVTIVHGLFAAFGAFFGAVFSGSSDARGGILSLLGSVGDILVSFDKWLTSGDKLVNSMRDVGTAAGEFVKPFLQAIGLVVKGIASLATGNGLSGIVDQFKSLGSASGALTSLSDAFQNLFSGDTVSSAGKFTSVIGDLKDHLTTLVSSSGGVNGIFKSIGSAIGSVSGEGVQLAGSIISGLASGIASAGPQVFSAMISLASGIIDSFKSAMGIHSPAETMVEPGINIAAGIGKGIGEGIQLIVNVIKGAAGLIKDAFNALFGGMNALDFAQLLNSIVSSAFLLAISNLVLKLGGSGHIFGGIINEMTNSLQEFQNALKAQALLDIAVAVGILVTSLVVLGLLKPKQIGQGIGAIATLMGTLVAAMKLMTKTLGGGVSAKNILVASAAMNEMATSMILMAGAVALFGNMDLGTLAKGFGAIALGLGIMVKSVNAMGAVGPRILASGAAIAIMAGAMTLLAGAVAIFGNMDLGTLAKGFGAIALGLGIMVKAVTAMGNVGPSIIASGAAIAVMATSMIILAQAVSSLGKLDLATLGKGFGAMALGLLLMVTALLAMSSEAEQAVIAAAAMLILAKSMVVMAKAVQAFGGMSWKELGKGFAAMAIGLVILLAAAAAAAYVAPGLIALGASIALIGAGVFLAGAGMLALATAISILTVVGTAGIAIMVVAIEAFIALLPGIATQVGAAFVSFLETIASMAPRVRAAMKTIIEALLGAIVDANQAISDTMVAFITTALRALRRTIPQFIETGRAIIDALLHAVSLEVPKLAEYALSMVQGFLEAIARHTGPIIQKGTYIIVTLLQGIGAATGIIADQMGKTTLDILTGIDKAVIKYATPIRNAGLKIMWHLIDGMTGGMAGAITSAVGDAIKEGLSHIDLSGAVKSVVASVGNIIPRTAGGNPFTAGSAAVNAAFGLANSNVPQGDPLIQAAQKDVVRSEAAARALAAKAAAARAKADKLAAIANKKKATASQKKAAKEADQAASSLEAKLQAAQDKASRAQDNFQSAIDFHEADVHGQADIRSGQAADLAQRANDLLAKANAEAAKARVLTGNAAKKMMAQAKQDAIDAKKLADQAKAAQAEANTLYAKEVNDRIAAMEKALADEEKKKAEDAAYEAADQAGKAKILQDRAAAADAEAAAAKAKAAQLVLEAKALAASDAVAAMKKLDEADTLTQQAQDAADRADEARKQAEELLNQPGTSTGSDGGGTITRPSTTALEDAAKVVDRFNASLQQATDLAAAGQTVVQYNQTVNAPTALDAATVYRQSKTLVAAQQFKMAGSG